MNELRGSLWRKWDLQVQTILDDGYIPLLNYYNELKTENPEKWELYISKVGGEENALKYDSKEYFFGTTDDEETRCYNYVRNLFAFTETYNPDLGLIALTDHNYKHNCLLDVFLKYSNNSNSLLKVICGVEINVSGVHILALFGSIPYSKENMSKGIETFLSKIDVHNPKTDGVLTVSGKSVADVLEKITSLNGLFIFPHCNSDNGLFQERGRTDRTYLRDVYNLNPTILLQTRNKKDIDRLSSYIENKNDDLRSIPVFTTSNDSRCLKDIGTPDSENNYTWVKADPTFEGFKQIIFENNERVSVQRDNPLKNYPKPHFSEIKINNTNIFEEGGVKFNSNTLPLNSNLIAIIGGRGTGKSLLLDAIAKTFGKTKKSQRSDKVSIASDDFQITYRKQDDTETVYKIGEINSLDYLHIHQGEVKDISDPENPEKLDSEIKNLLKLSTYDEEQPEFSDSTIEKLINEIFDIRDWLNFEDDEGNLSNSQEFNQSKKKEKEDLINTITTEENKQLIQDYTQNLIKINEVNQYIIKANKIQNELNRFQNTTNDDINSLNKLIENDDYKIPVIDFKHQSNSLKNLIESKENELKALKEKNGEIEKSFEKAGIKGNISTLLEQLEIYQHDINTIDKKIKEAGSKQTELKKKFEQIGKIADLIKESHQNYISIIQKKWEQLKAGKVDWNNEQKELVSQLLYEIEIEAIEQFNHKIFYEGILECLNLQKFREKKGQSRIDRVLETFNIKNQESFIQLLKGEKIIDINEAEKIGLAELLGSDLFTRDGARKFLRTCLLSSFRKKFWRVLTSSKFKNKEIYQLSVGQRGTFYVCLKLATDPFLKPFIFDQPEDDLDNDFIMHHLVPIFKKIKKYRQVIIVTHNANLVVNSDAEQVIIATNENEILNYKSGSIENTPIRKEICKILEGGEDAFTKREQKYGFSSF